MVYLLHASMFEIGFKQLGMRMSKEKEIQRKRLSLVKTQFQIKGGGMVQGVTKLITTFSNFLT